MNKYAAFSKVAEKKANRMCHNKIRFNTEAEALAQRAMTAYHCPICGGYHRSASEAKLLAVLKARQRK